jgi:hypothetical protein
VANDFNCNDSFAPLIDGASGANRARLRKKAGFSARKRRTRPTSGILRPENRTS